MANRLGHSPAAERERHADPAQRLEGVRLREVPLELSLPGLQQYVRASRERLLLDELEGNTTLFSSLVEVEAAELIDGIQTSWRRRANRSSLILPAPGGPRPRSP